MAVILRVNNEYVLNLNTRTDQCFVEAFIQEDGQDVLNQPLMFDNSSRIYELNDDGTQTYVGRIQLFKDGWGIGDNVYGFTSTRIIPIDERYPIFQVEKDFALQWFKMKGITND